MDATKDMIRRELEAAYLEKKAKWNDQWEKKRDEEFRQWPWSMTSRKDIRKKWAEERQKAYEMAMTSEVGLALVAAAQKKKDAEEARKKKEQEESKKKEEDRQLAELQDRQLSYMEFAIQKATKAFEDYREVKAEKRQLSYMEFAIQKATKALDEYRTVKEKVDAKAKANGQERIFSSELQWARNRCLLAKMRLAGVEVEWHDQREENTSEEEFPEFLPWPWSMTSRKDKVEAFRKKRAEDRKKAEEVHKMAMTGRALAAAAQKKKNEKKRELTCREKLALIRAYKKEAEEARKKEEKEDSDKEKEVKKNEKKRDLTCRERLALIRAYKKKEAEEAAQQTKVES